MPRTRSTKLKVVSIYSEVEHSIVSQRLEAGKISGCGPFVPQLTSQDIEATPVIVGQIGPEPFVQAMAAHPDFDMIIGGRAYDPAPYVAFCAFHAFRKSYQPVLSLDSGILGGFMHMGKIMECGGLCATPKSAPAMATVYQDGVFDVMPLQPGSRCTTTSVAAHTLYEKSRPDRLYGPGGYMDLTAATYTQLSDQTSVRVQGTLFQSSTGIGERYTVKLEGAKVAGYRTIFMGSFADPILIEQLPNLLEVIKEYVTQQHKGVDGKWELGFHTYGRDQILQNSASSGASAPFVGQIFLVGEAFADTQSLATSVATTAKTACIHGSYKGQKATSGNFGFGLGGKSEFETGPCAMFSLYHLMALDEGEEEALEMRADSEALVDDATSGQKLFRFEHKILGSGARIEHRIPTLENAKTRNELALKPTPSSTGPLTSIPSAAPRTLGEAAKVIRSKNAGPYEITMDIIFDNTELYKQIKNSDILQPGLIAELYGLQAEDIVYCGFFDQALAFKATIPRLRDGKPAISGGFMENDVHGSQGYMPLFNLELKLPVN